VILDHCTLSTRLYWSGICGVAMIDGGEVPLKVRPEIPGLEFRAIDYAPPVVMTIQPPFDRERDLEPHEQAMALAALQRIVRGKT
jgi:hypothetical protein